MRKPQTLPAELMPEIARRLIAAVKQFDVTRPVTMALADIDASNATGVASMLDVTGYNYLEQHYGRDHKAYPTRVIYGSENSRNLEAWRSVAVNDYIGGQFLWTGMDYLGEGERYPNRGFESGLARSGGILEAGRLSPPGALERQAHGLRRRLGRRLR